MDAHAVAGDGQLSRIMCFDSVNLKSKMELTAIIDLFSTVLKSGWVGFLNVLFNTLDNSLT